jgi:peptidoglycan hydrolase-like protein with peptidoglycan-binding domain
VAVALSFIAVPAFAQTDGDRADLSPEFAGQARDSAMQVAQVSATGTSMSAPSGHVDTRDMANVGPDGAAIVDCPDGKPDANAAAWKDIPEGLRKIARPGACYSRLLIPPKFNTYTDHVVVQQARTETRNVPEVAQLVEKDVMVQPAHTVRHTVAAVTHTEMVTEVVRPATMHDEVIPAQYETRVQHVMVAPERREWVKSSGYATGAALVTPGDHEPVRYRADGTLTWPGKDGGAVVPASQETAEYLQRGSAQAIWCLQVVPAVYRDQQVRVEVTPASSRHVEVPAVTRQVSRVVVDVPEHVVEDTVPPVFEKRRVKEVITPAHVEAVDVPAVYHDETKTRVTDAARPVWREVLCQKNASPAVIMDIQKALAGKGYDPGAIDGHIGSKTVSAMQKFEADTNLPQGQISIEAVKALGVNLAQQD